jgi:hypothetical protein
MHFEREKQNGPHKRNQLGMLSYKQKKMKHSIAVILALCVLLSGVWNATAESSSVREYQIKAAFLYNFSKFVEWPQGSFTDAKSPFVICVLGEDPFDNALDTIKEKNIDGRKIVIERMESIKDEEKCHILFVSASERRDLSQIFRAVKQRNILTVSDMKGFAGSGGIINFISADNRIGFEINVSAAEKANLKISSKLLKLGNIVN